MSKNAGDYNHQELFTDGDDDIYIDTLDSTNNKNYPGAPEWLVIQCAKNRVNESADLTISGSNANQLKELLKDFTDAKNDFYLAYQIACKYETGDIIGGIDQVEAILWYLYAAEIGSPHAAMRCFYLKQDASYLKLALTNATNLLSQPRLLGIGTDNDLKLAVAASFKLLTLQIADQSIIEKIEFIFNHRHFKNVPVDANELLVKQYQLFLAGDKKIKSHQVVKHPLVDDSDFKVGIYKSLNLRLPLVALGTNLDLIKSRLDEEFPWFKLANHEVFKQLKARLLLGTSEFKLRPILLAGSSGTGKTSWAKRLAELCKVPFSMVMAGGSSDSMHLKGLARGWGSSHPCAVAKLISVEKVGNPLIIVDEIDKVSSSNHNGSLHDVLLQLIEPATNSNYMDECLQVPCDFSWVSWIATCNQLGNIPKPLLDRFTVIHIAKPSEDHAQTIINGAIKNYAAELKIDVRMLPSIGFEQFELLQKLSPREINKVVRIIIENQLADKANVTVH